MTKLPPYEIKVYDNDSQIPAEAETLFEKQLADSRRLEERDDRDMWRFALTCAVSASEQVLGGVHLDIGPIGSGPIGREKVAYLERTLVRPEYRRQGLATQVLQKAIEVAKAADCQHLRCHNNWDNAAETALFRKCGFALVDLTGEDDDDPSYLAVKPLEG